jgi:hypothetical protein
MHARRNIEQCVLRKKVKSVYFLCLVEDYFNRALVVTVGYEYIKKNGIPFGVGRIEPAAARERKREHEAETTPSIYYASNTFIIKS